LAVIFVECDHTAVLAAMCIGVTAMGGMFSGIYSNNMDIAPHYAGIHHACILFCFFVTFFMCVCGGRAGGESGCIPFSNLHISVCSLRVIFQFFFQSYSLLSDVKTY
jgi:hypothetical protein